MHKITLLIIIAAIFVLGFFVTKNTLSKIYSDIGRGRVQMGNLVIQKAGCDADCKKQIAEEVSKSLASVSAVLKAQTASPGQNTTPKPQDSYIQISGTGSTQNLNWTDVPGTDFSFDVNRDFGQGAHFAWEGFLRVADANGTAYARIYDATHGIGVNGSEISVSNVSEYTRAISTNMNFWAGRNVYRVQIKSLNTFNVEYTGGKIRVSY